MATKLAHNIEHIGHKFDVDAYEAQHGINYLNEIYTGQCLRTHAPYDDTMYVVTVGLQDGRVLWWQGEHPAKYTSKFYVPPYTEEELEYIRENYLTLGAEHCALTFGRGVEAVKAKARKMGILVSRQ